MAKILGLDLLRRVLLKSQDMLARSHFQLPCLDLLVPRECVRLQDSCDNTRKLAFRLIHIVDIASVALDSGFKVVLISLGFGSDRQLGHLLWGFISDDDLASSLDVEDQGVGSEDVVEGSMLSVSGTASIEAVQADIKAGRVILVPKVRTVFGGRSCYEGDSL
tara:strand:- start:8 stop:496 length:489 start_codon:yes stop_codon:yes gene_type:complete